MINRVFAIVALVAIFANSPLNAAPRRAYWVFFKEAYTPADAQNNRVLPAALLRKIARAGATIRERSRWFGAVSVNADARALERIRQLREVAFVQPVNAMQRLDAKDAGPLRSVDTNRNLNIALPDTAYGFNLAAYREINIPAAHTLGFTGQGIRIAILDTGFRTDHESLTTARIVGRRDFIQNDAVVSNQAGDDPTQEVHGTEVLSLLAGNKPGLLMGTAFEAEFLLAKVDKEPGDTEADEDRWVAALEWADSMGARIINSSIGFRFAFTDKPAYPFEAMNGRTTITSRAAAAAARRGILLVNAAGNYGPAPGTIVAPADADSIISVGATDSLGRPAVFNSTTQPGSSRGPTSDQRIKPGLVARGINVRAASPFTPFGYFELAGTSISTPLIAGASALVMQAWPSLSMIAIRQALFLSGSRSANPDNNVGYGLPNTASAILFPGGLFVGDITSITATTLTTVTPTFGWVAPLVHPNIRPVKFRLQIASDTSFVNIVYADSVNDAFSLAIRRPLRPGNYFWRVVAEANPNIRRVTRTAGPFTMPHWVRLVSFAGTVPEFVATLRPTIVFDPLPGPPPAGPLVYDVQILSAQSGTIVQTIPNVQNGLAVVPQPLTPNGAFLYRVITRAPSGIADTVQSVAPFVPTTSTAPPSTTLYQNFPNPFPRADGRTSTQIWFDLSESTTVELSVYDIRGRLIRRLVPAPPCTTVTLQPGLYGRGSESPDCVVTAWDGKDDSGRAMERGVYIIRLRTQSVEQSRRVLYVPD